MSLKSMGSEMYAAIGIAHRPHRNEFCELANPLLYVVFAALLASDKSGSEPAFVNAREPLIHSARQDGRVRDFAKVLGNVPETLPYLGSHPVSRVEPRQIYGTSSKCAQRAITRVVEIVVKVTYRELPQTAIHRLAIAQAGKV